MSKVDDELKKIIGNIRDEELENKEAGLTASDKIRLIAQGALLNYSDEAIAGIKSLLSDKSYDEIVQLERNILAQAREKDGSLKYEFGGAMAPALLALPFTGGTSVPLTMGRVAVMSGGQGLVASLGAQDETIEPLEVAVETGISTVAGPLFAKLGQGISGIAKKGFEKTYGSIMGNLNKNVEDKIIEIAGKANVTPEDIIEAVQQGKIIPEINKDMSENIRALYAKSSVTGPILRESLEKRATDAPKKVTADLQKSLAKDQPTGNILQDIQKSEKALKANESKAYKRVFDANKNLNNPEIDDLVLQVVNRINPKVITKDINLINTMKGLPEVFKKNKDGSFSLNRSLSLEEAEKTYRVIRDFGQGLARKDNKFEVSSGVKELSNILKAKIDEVSPDLARVRASYKKIFDGKESFEQGTKLLGMNADQAEIDINRILNTKDTDLIKAYRAGIASNIRSILDQRGGKGAFVRRLNNPESKERRILQRIIPDDDLQNILTGASKAVDSIDTRNIVLRGSQTAITEGRKQDIKPTSITQIGADVIEAVNFYNPVAAVRAIRNLIPDLSRQMSDKQLRQMANTLIEEDADVIRDAFTNMESRNAMLNKLQRMANTIITGGTTITATQTPNIVDPNIRLDMGALASETDKDVSEFVGNLPMSARMKILNSVDMT
jgi:hypothetical protein